MDDNIREREKVAKEIAKTAESIRKKHRALKTGKIDDDIAVKTHFKPIIEPLQKIVDNATILVKDEPDTDDGGVKIEPRYEGETSKKRKTIKRYKEEEEETPKKRKHQDILQDISKPLDALLPTTSTPKSAQPVTLVDENVFETTRNPPEISLRHWLKSSEGQHMMRKDWGPLGQEYMGALLGADEKKEIDNVYGVYFGENEMRIGNKRFAIDKDDNIIIGDTRYIGTPGLYELIFKKRPDYQEDDLRKYKHILLATNAHKRNFDAQGRVKSSKGDKYKYIIAPLMRVESESPKSGRGMPRAMTLTDNKIDYVHWDDPNELVDRLRLLDASRQAGNNAHDNEILSIIEELREAGIIIN